MQFFYFHILLLLNHGFIFQKKYGRVLELITDEINYTMGQIIEFIGLSKVLEATEVAIRDAFPNFGKTSLLLIDVFANKFSQNYNYNKW